VPSTGDQQRPRERTDDGLPSHGAAGRGYTLTAEGQGGGVGPRAPRALRL